uniref:Testis-specific serine/threonine-protein kinase 2 n=1 Tax=Cacopsylla melanoneura TaxID=428564 RepID=A0A8D8VTB1_9HEMI
MADEPPKPSMNQLPVSPPETLFFPSQLNCYYDGKLGEGAYGKVYRVRDRTTGRIRACKVYDFKKMKKNYLKKFVPRETDIMLKVSHPNIITTHCICRSGSSMYILMDIAERQDLEHYIIRVCRGNIKEAQAKIWIKQIASALEYLHEIGTGHRDIKCENILITRCLNARLADFGFSRFFNTPKDHSKTFSGTASYAAPEILKNIPYISRSTDIWSLGIVLYRVLNKKFPFGDLNTKKRQETQEYTFSTQYDISMDAKKLIHRMLTLNPGRRPSAKEVQSDAWCQGASMSLIIEDDQKEALETGRSKRNELQKRLRVVDELVNSDNTEVMAELIEKKYADKGDIISDRNLKDRVCSYSPKNFIENLKRTQIRK